MVKGIKQQQVQPETKTHKRNTRYTLLQDGQQSAIAAITKPHAHIIMTQMNVREGIKRFGEKGNKTLLKELNQLHQQEALLPIK